MKKSSYPYWIKERHNPQTGTYYVACGQLSATAAKRFESTKYGENTMLRFETEAAYKKRLAELHKEGKRVQ